MTYEYGTAKYYAELFSDCLADVDAENPDVAANLFEGFLIATDEWLVYHQAQANAYAQLRQRVREALAM